MDKTIETIFYGLSFNQNAGISGFDWALERGWFFYYNYILLSFKKTFIAMSIGMLNTS